MNIDQLNRWFHPWKNRILSIARFGIINSTDDTLPVQKTQVQTLADVVQDNIERFQNYGFTSNPQAGAEAFVIYPGGEQSHGLIVAIEDRRFRIVNLAPGEVAIYTDEGDSIQFKRGRIMNIVTQTLNISAKDVNFNATNSFNVTAPNMSFTASTQALFTTALLKVTQAIQSATATISGALSAGSVTSTGAVSGSSVSDSTGNMATVRSKFNTHTHKENGVSGSPDTLAPTQQM